MRAKRTIERTIVIIMAALVLFYFTAPEAMQAADIIPEAGIVETYVGIEPMALDLAVKVADLAPEVMRMFATILAGMGISFNSPAAINQTVGGLQISECLAVELNGIEHFLCACCSSRTAANISQALFNQAIGQILPQLSPMVQGNQLVVNSLPDFITGIQDEINVPVINNNQWRGAHIRFYSHWHWIGINEPFLWSQIVEISSQLRNSLPSSLSIGDVVYTLGTPFLANGFIQTGLYANGNFSRNIVFGDMGGAPSVNGRTVEILGFFLGFMNSHDTAKSLMVMSLHITPTGEANLISTSAIPSSLLTINPNAITNPTTTIGNLQAANGLTDALAALNAAIAAAGVTGAQDITISVPATIDALVNATPQQVSQSPSLRKWHDAETLYRRRSQRHT